MAGSFYIWLDGTTLNRLKGVGPPQLHVATHLA
jgi:hypothetical protein